jgi:hypothetical protein
VSYKANKLDKITCTSLQKKLGKQNVSGGEVLSFEALFFSGETMWQLVHKHNGMACDRELVLANPVPRYIEMPPSWSQSAT